MSEAKALVTNYLKALSGQPKTPEVIKRFVSDEHLAQHILETEAAFRNYELIAQDMVAEGSKVAVRGEFRGTHSGPFAGLDPTGKQGTAGLIIIYEISGDKIANHWMQLDTASLLQQLQR